MNKVLIDAYLSEIGRQLPRKTRRDIEEEIRSALMDILEARQRESGKEIDDEMILEVLQEYARLETEHFVIRYDGRQDELLAQYAARYLAPPGSFQKHSGMGGAAASQTSSPCPSRTGRPRSS